MARGLRSLSPSLLSFLSTHTTQFPPTSRLAMLPLLGSSENMLASHLDISCFFPHLEYRELSLLLSYGIKMLKRSEKDVSREKKTASHCSICPGHVLPLLLPLHAPAGANCFLMCCRIIFRQDSGRNAITRASS